ncbi:hypothetical protein AA15669_1683 [Saccharibacter floricola DSM 15669]|uniref:Uncharacterized protein n=1 Tax=Saccharibacter floricola DSM 15669 TaxID=1123227 RepID=A0ABQ0P0F9_9PROT|nr:hypothetical protein AA15669_1683 [Saccharibacter floricola DSM 15669]
MVPDSVTELLGGIATVADNITRSVRQIIKKNIGRWHLMCLPGRKCERQRFPMSVSYAAELGTKSSM